MEILGHPTLASEYKQLQNKRSKFCKIGFPPQTQEEKEFLNKNRKLHDLLFDAWRKGQMEAMHKFFHFDEEGDKEE